MEIPLRYAGHRPGFRPVELSRHVDIVRTWSQPVRAIFHYAIVIASRSASRAGRKLDGVMEFGF